MIITLTVTDLSGDERTVRPGFGHVCQYEKYASRSVLSWQRELPGVRDFAILAWITETGMVTPFDAWTDTVSMVVMTGFSKANPTMPAATAG